MQKFQNSVSDIRVSEKTVQYCGKTIKKQTHNNSRSKKRVKWILHHKLMEHTITCTISFMSGKKSVIHNGLTVVDKVDTQQSLVVIVMLGLNRIKIRIEKDVQELKFEQGDVQVFENAFVKWKNIMSGEASNVYQHVFTNN